MCCLVSVVMPAYNAQSYISESIESVISQSYLKWELLIVDDGSTDNTRDIIYNYCLKDSRIKYYYQQNGRQGKARNLALKYSKGNYIAFLDSDDLWLPDKLKHQINLIQLKDVDLVFSDSYIFEKDFQKEEIIKMNYEAGLFFGREAINKFCSRNRIPILTVLVKAISIKDVGGFSENINIQNAEDYHLWLRLLIDNKVFYGSKEPLAAYRNSFNSATGNDICATENAIAALQNIGQLFPDYSNEINEGLKSHLIKNHYLKQQRKRKRVIEIIKRKLINNQLRKFILNSIIKSRESMKNFLIGKFN